MKSQLAFSAILVAICGFGAWMLAADRHAPSPVSHCLSRSGALDRAVQESLSTGDVCLVLRWVQPSDHLRMREMFDRVQHLRQRGDAEVRSFAEQSFFDAVEHAAADRSDLSTASPQYALSLGR